MGTGVGEMLEGGEGGPRMSDLRTPFRFVMCSSVLKKLLGWGMGYGRRWRGEDMYLDLDSSPAIRSRWSDMCI